MLFSEKNKKNIINLSSAEIAQSPNGYFDNHITMFKFCCQIEIAYSWVFGQMDLSKRFGARSDAAECSIWPGPEVIKLFSCSTQLSMKFVQLINLNLLIIANPFLLNISDRENFSANK